MTTRDLFCYGLFADAAVLEDYGVAPTASRRAVLAGFELVIADRSSILPRTDSETAGIVHTLTDAQIAQLYSGPGLEAYTPSSVEVRYDDGSHGTVTTYSLGAAEAGRAFNAEYAVKLRALRTRLGLPVDTGASPYQLAQLNVAVLIAPLDSPPLGDFVNNLDRINALADRSPGFVWRLQTEEGNATALRPFDEQTLVNLSVWEDFESLRRFVYLSDHATFVRRRREFFQRSIESTLVLWWVPRGHIPSIAEAKERLDRLRLEGPTENAFEFRRIFAAPTTVPRR